jgi:3-oxoacyl-[acyl-carrier protein] reductase
MSASSSMTSPGWIADMDLGLRGKVALIFGASRGIGAATARVLAGEGAHLALAARGAPDALAAELGGRAYAVDLTAAGAADSCAAQVLVDHGRIDCVVISAGAAQGGLFWELDDAVWRDAIDLKFMGMMRALRAVAPIMRDQGSGSIVGVVGNLGRQPGKRLLPGSCANAACLALLRGAAEELAPHGVRVNAVNPGPTRTDRWATLMGNLSRSSGQSPVEVEADYVTGIPFGRIAEADEIARAIALLASDRIGPATGASLTIDGGATKGIV